MVHFHRLLSLPQFKQLVAQRAYNLQLNVIMSARLPPSYNRSVFSKLFPCTSNCCHYCWTLNTEFIIHLRLDRQIPE